MSNVFDPVAVKQAVHDLLKAMGEDPGRDGLKDTPQRVARAWEEMLSGLHSDPSQVLERTFQIDHEEVVLVRDIAFHSCCEHHLLPFFGVAHVAYLPSGKQITGLSKLARLVDGYAHRLQVQERLGTQVATAIMERLGARGAICVLEGEHLCMSMRGIKKPGAKTLTVTKKGIFRDDPLAAQEVLNMILRH